MRIEAGSGSVVHSKRPPPLHSISVQEGESLQLDYLRDGLSGPSDLIHHGLQVSYHLVLIVRLLVHLLHEQSDVVLLLPQEYLYNTQPHMVTVGLIVVTVRPYLRIYVEQLL